MRRLACALVLLGACGSDPCASRPPGETCLGLRIGGKLNPGATELDALQVDVTYRGLTVANDRTHRTLSRAPQGKSAALPVELAVAFPDGTGASGRVVVVALRNDIPVGIASDSVFVGAERHQTIDLELEPSVTSRCFNGVRDSGERDRDCGGSSSGCPACTAGRACFDDEDCAGLACVNDVCGGSGLP